MNDLRDTLHLQVEYFTGLEEGDEDVGHPYYVASCKEISAVTDGETLDELFTNVREIISLTLEDEDTIAVYRLVPHPRIVITMELPDYAQIA